MCLVEMVVGFFGLEVECKKFGSLRLFQTVFKRKLNVAFSEEERVKK